MATIVSVDNGCGRASAIAASAGDNVAWPFSGLLVFLPRFPVSNEGTKNLDDRASISFRILGDPLQRVDGAKPNGSLLFSEHLRSSGEALSNLTLFQKFCPLPGDRQAEQDS